MNIYPDNGNAKSILAFTNKLGVVLEDVLQHVHVTLFKGFTFLPDMAMHFGSFRVINDFTRVTGQSDIADGIGIIFHNIFEDDADKSAIMQKKNTSPMEPPYVRIFPYMLSQSLDFKKKTPMCLTFLSVLVRRI